MKKFDRYIKQRISEEEKDLSERELPDSVRFKIDQALQNLPKENKTCTNRKMPRIHHSFALAAACFLFLFLFLLPNVSPVCARALEKIPVIGEFVKVITIRNYFYSDDNHELDVSVPGIEDADNEAIDTINADAEDLADALVDKFYQDLEQFGEYSHRSVYVNYEVLTDTPEWFTLKLYVEEVTGSSNTYYKYYNLDKVTGKIVTIGDFAAAEEFYSTVTQDIKKQMKQRMEEDDEASYYIAKDSFGEEFAGITAEHNYYWDGEGNLVIPFDKYEVAPGYMGTPEFTIDYDLIKDLIIVPYASRRNEA